MHQAIYKCRLCGEEFSDMDVSKETADKSMKSLSILDKTTHIAMGNCVFMGCTHNCQNGSFGLADFQGFKKVEVSENE